MRLPNSHPLWAALIATAPMIGLVATTYAQEDVRKAPHVVNPMVYPLTSTPFGKTYGEWSAEHWKYVFSLPVDQNPLIDQTGANCANGQSGPVWFLSGTFCPEPPLPCEVAVATRSCAVPAGKAIFFPLIDAECSTLEGNGTTEAELRTCAIGFQDLAADQFCEVDGVPVLDVDHYRVQSPLFTIGPLPDNNLFQFFGLDAPAGTTTPSVSDGVFIMLRPLAAGHHTVHFGGAIPTFGFGVDVTYHLTVQTGMATSEVPTGPAPLQATTWGRLKTIYR